MIECELIYECCNVLFVPQAIASSARGRGMHEKRRGPIKVTFFVASVCVWVDVVLLVLYCWCCIVDVALLMSSVCVCVFFLAYMLPGHWRN